MNRRLRDNHLVGYIKAYFLSGPNRPDGLKEFPSVVEQELLKPVLFEKLSKERLLNFLDFSHQVGPRLTKGGLSECITHGYPIARDGITSGTPRDLSVYADNHVATALGRIKRAAVVSQPTSEKRV